MSDLYKFAGEHPIVFVILAFTVADVCLYPLKLVNRLIRHMNLRKCGWPPAHLDADGDVIKKDAT